MADAKVKERFSASQIARRIDELANEIRADAGDTEIMLIGILKGTAVFMADLLRAIPGQVQFEYIDVVREISDTEIAAAMEIDFMMHFDMRGKNVYLLKDVVSTGVIENYLLTQFRMRTPANLKLVALLDRPDLRTMELEVDFRAFQATNGTFVGYGLELRGQYANLAYIGSI
ncbi:MAG TPA: phosphoribosyltransferase family protein [Thermoanaerobaculia bacterium]